MKKAFRYIGIGFFLSALLLTVIYKLNVNIFSFFNSNVQVTTSSTNNVTSTTHTMTTTSQSKSSTLSVEPSTSTTVVTTSNTFVEIVVESTDVSYIVAQKLVDAGILAETSTFNQYMESNNLARFIQTGRFKIPIGSSLEQLGKILTTYPGN